MIEYLELGSSPAEEDCAQVGVEDYDAQARKEGKAYINQLHRLFPTAKEKGVYLRLKSNAHDFGTYYEVAAYYDTEDAEQIAIAFSMEAHLPATWDAEARKELRRKK